MINGDVLSASSGGGAATWGGIIGTLSNQADLQAALDAKADKDTDAVQNNVAKFDANGNPVDSGYAASNILGLSYTVVSTWT